MKLRDMAAHRAGVAGRMDVQGVDVEVAFRPLWAVAGAPGVLALCYRSSVVPGSCWHVDDVGAGWTLRHVDDDVVAQVRGPRVTTWRPVGLAAGARAMDGEHRIAEALALAGRFEVPVRLTVGAMVERLVRVTWTGRGAGDRCGLFVDGKPSSVMLRAVRLVVVPDASRSPAFVDGVGYVLDNDDDPFALAAP